MSLIPINRRTFIDPESSRIALITDAQDADNRRIWLVVPGTRDEPIEVERRYHQAILRAMRVDLGVNLDAAGEGAEGKFA
jgi:hypothetical protein